MHNFVLDVTQCNINPDRRRFIFLVSNNIKAVAHYGITLH